MPSYYIMKFCSSSIVSCLDDCIKPASDSTYEHPKWGLDFSFLTKQHRMYVKDEDKDNSVEFRSGTGSKRVRRDELARTSLLLKIQKWVDGKEIPLRESAKTVLDHPVIHMYIHKRWDEIKPLNFDIIQTIGGFQTSFSVV